MWFSRYAHVCCIVPGAMATGIQIILLTSCREVKGSRGSNSARVTCLALSTSPLHKSETDSTLAPMAVLTEEQKRRIEENRKRALERLKLRKGAGGTGGTGATSTSSVSKQGSSQQRETANVRPLTESAPASVGVASGPSDSSKVIPELPRVELTPEQRRRIDENRRKAIEIQKERKKHLRDASVDDGPIAVVTEQDRKRLRADRNLPSIQKKDYIEFDFAQMKDSRGGFLDENEKLGLRGPEEEPQSLQEWKERQKQAHLVKELAPPLDLANAPRCYECDSLEVDANLLSNFQARVCRRCMKEKPEKYSLLTKTECREDYLLTDPELRDTSLLKRIEKPNPHGFSRMQLYLRFQVEEFAWKKWGSAEGLDQEWERREKARLDRRDKRYQAKIREMRKKTRAEEYTRKLRDGKTLGSRHEHDWSAPLAVDNNPKLLRRRCVECGIETEEVVI